MMFWYGSGWSFWQSAAMWIGMIAFWGLIGWAIYAIVSTSRTRSARHVDADGDARVILDARFARGEIDEEAYRRARKVLVGDQSGRLGTDARR